MAGDGLQSGANEEGRSLAVDIGSWLDAKVTMAARVVAGGLGPVDPD